MYYRHMLYVMAKEEAAWLKTTFYFLPISLYLSIERKVPYFFLSPITSAFAMSFTLLSLCAFFFVLL